MLRVPRVLIAAMGAVVFVVLLLVGVCLWHSGVLTHWHKAVIARGCYSTQHQTPGCTEHHRGFTMDMVESSGWDLNLCRALEVLMLLCAVAPSSPLLWVLRGNRKRDSVSSDGVLSTARGL